MKLKTQNILALAVLAATTLTSTVSLAESGGSWILRGGYASVNPTGESDPVLGGTVEADNAAALGLTATYFLDDNWGIGILAATPFSHDVNHNVAGKVGETKQLPPTVTAQYHFNLDNSPIKPYLGIGFNYTNFFEEETTGALAGTTLELDDSFGVAFEAGVDYSLNDKWGVSFQTWYIQIDTDATVSSVGAPDTNFNVEIDPMVYMLGVSYKL